MSNARRVKGKNFGLSLDLPSEILERREKKMKQFNHAKKDNKTAFLVERSRINCLLTVLKCKNIRKIVRPHAHIFSNYSKLYFYYFAKNCGAKTRMLLIKIKIARCQSEVALTTLAGRYFIFIFMYCVSSLWPLLVFVIVFRVIFVSYCSLVVILIIKLPSGNVVPILDISPKQIYQIFLQQKQIGPTAKQKLSNKYSNIDIDWKKVYTLAFQCTLDTKISRGKFVTKI